MWWATEQSPELRQNLFLSQHEIAHWCVYLLKPRIFHFSLLIASWSTLTFCCGLCSGHRVLEFQELKDQLFKLVGDKPLLISSKWKNMNKTCLLLNIWRFFYASFTWRCVIKLHSGHSMSSTGVNWQGRVCCMLKEINTSAFQHNYIGVISGSVQMKRVKFNTRLEPEFITNFKLVQAAFNKMGVTQASIHLYHNTSIHQTRYLSIWFVSQYSNIDIIKEIRPWLRCNSLVGLYRLNEEK